MCPPPVWLARKDRIKNDPLGPPKIFQRLRDVFSKLSVNLEPKNSHYFIYKSRREVANSGGFFQKVGKIAILRIFAGFWGP